MTRPFSSQDERDAFRESLPASDMFVVPTSEVRMLLDALDAAERRIRDLKFAMGDEAGWFDRFTAERKRADAAERRAAEAEGLEAPAVAMRERALALASVATVGHDEAKWQAPEDDGLED